MSKTINLTCEAPRSYAGNTTPQARVYDRAAPGTALSGLTPTLVDVSDANVAAFDVKVAGLPDDYTPGRVEFDFSDSPGFRTIRVDAAPYMAYEDQAAICPYLEQSVVAGTGSVVVSGLLQVSGQNSPGEKLEVWDSADANLVASVITGQDGRFRKLRLDPGNYIFKRSIHYATVSRRLTVPNVSSVSLDSLTFWS